MNILVKVARGFLFSFVVLNALFVSAKTIAWYRFEDSEGGPVMETTSFVNAIDKEKYPAFAGVCNFGGNSRYAKSSLVYTPELMPVRTNAFTTVELTDPRGAPSVLENKGSLALNMSKINSAGSPHAQLFVDDHEDLRLQTFTLEFFVRIPDTTTGFRCIAVRSGREYNAKYDTFRLSADVNNNENKTLYYKLTVAYAEDPEYDSDGRVLNSVASTAIVCGSGENYDNDKWHHVAIVVDGDNKTATLYLNYIRKGTINYRGDLIYDLGCPLAFGGHPQCTYYNSAASFDEIRLSDEVLSPEQMLGYRAKIDEKSRDAVDARTLLYFPFEGASSDVVYGDEMRTPLSAFVPAEANRAVNAAFQDVKVEALSRKGITEFSNPEIVGDVPAQATRFGLRATNAMANEQGVHIVTNTPTCQFAAPYVIKTSDNTQADLFGESCTFEAFFKGEKNKISLGNTTSTHLFTLVNCFQILTRQDTAWNNGYIMARIGDKMMETKSSSNPTGGVGGYLNGQWHHVALVYDKEAGRGDLYLDYQWMMGANDPTLTLSPHASYVNGVILGGSYWSDRSLSDFTIDEVRISRGALRPYEFLTTRSVEVNGSLLARASFEESFAVGPYADFFPEPVTGKFVSDGKVPMIDNAKPAVVITRGKGGPVEMDSNRHSLKFVGGMVTYPMADLVGDVDTFTLEMFVKAPSAVPGAGIARVNRGSSTGVSEAVTWALSFADAEGKLKLKVDTDVGGTQSHVFEEVAFADGVWHHIGIQFAPSGENTAIRLFKDAVPVGVWNVSGRVVTRPRESNFMLGAGEESTASFIGWIDEIRISPSIVDVSEFLSPELKGLLLIYR